MFEEQIEPLGGGRTQVGSTNNDVREQLLAVSQRDLCNTRRSSLYHGDEVSAYFLLYLV